LIQKPQTFRNVQYEAYKANLEQAQPEDISIAIPWVKRIVKAFNIHPGG